jgi:hypothetical protein
MVQDLILGLASVSLLYQLMRISFTLIQGEIWLFRGCCLINGQVLGTTILVIGEATFDIALS